MLALSGMSGDGSPSGVQPKLKARLFERDPSETGYSTRGGC